jgi:sulfur relay (sulfurtransferase) DsrF/TusC family protein
MKKILQIVESAYRGTLEEQDDTVIWLSHIMKDAGSDLDILLRGNSVHYLVRKQDASGLMFGNKKQTQPPRIMDDISKIIKKGVTIHFVSEDAYERGIDQEEMISEVKKILRNELPTFFSNYQHILHW